MPDDQCPYERWQRGDRMHQGEPHGDGGRGQSDATPRSTSSPQRPGEAGGSLVLEPSEGVQPRDPSILDTCFQNRERVSSHCFQTGNPWSLLSATGKHHNLIWLRPGTSMRNIFQTSYKQLPSVFI